MRRFALTGIFLLGAAAIAGAQTISVSAAFAPNAFGSAQYDPWRANTISALVGGVNQFGTVGTSYYYDNIAGNTYTTRDNIVTDFQSWRGMAPGIYSPELGTRTHFPVKIVSDTRFNLTQVLFDMNSSDSGNVFDYDGDLAGTDFGSGSRRGVNYGADNLPGGTGANADTIYDISNPGNDTVLINELEYVGIGNAIEALSSDPGATNQDKINGIAGQIDPYVLSVTYSVQGQLGSGTTGVNFTQPVPEPASLAVLGLGAMGLLRRRARRS